MTREAFFRALKTLINYRVTAGVLQLTLGIGIVVCVICASMILLVYFNRLAFLHYQIEDRLRDNAHSAIAYGMASHDQLAMNVPITVDLFGEETDSVSIIRKPWGVFETLTVTAWQGNHSQSRTALISAQPDEIGKAVIYTPENNAPIYLVGKTLIEGTAYTSERKFTTGYVGSRGFEGEKLFAGEVKQSEAQIQGIDTTLLFELKNILEGQTRNYQLKHLDLLPVRKKMSFQSTHSNYYYTNQSIDLTDSLSGNLIIHSAIKIRVTSGAVLADVILIAPDIDLDNGFEGNIQCFASRSIIVGRDCKLKYPSVLSLLPGERDSLIAIRENAVVTGHVVIAGQGVQNPSKARFKIDKNATLHGMAYINASAEIQGKLWGHIMTRMLMAKSGSSEYPGHVMDAELSGRKRSKYLPGSLLWANNGELIVAKWLK